MPKEFQPNGSCYISPRPKKSDQLAECTNAPTTCLRPSDKPSNKICEQLIVRPLVNHEPCQSILGDESDVFSSQPWGRHIQAGILQPLFKRRKMLRRGKDDGTFACFQSPAHESGQRIEQHAVIFIELGYMLAGSDLAPECWAPA